MQNEGNVEGRCIVGCPFSKVVTQRVINYRRCI